MFGPMSRCVPSFGRGQQPCTPDGLGLVSGICGGRKKKQDKGQASKPPLCPVTSARSAGSYGGFSGDRKWGQKQTAGISFRVTFPESLETRRKSRGHTGDIQGFLLRCHTVPAGAPLRNCGAENNNRALLLAPSVEKGSIVYAPQFLRLFDLQLRHSYATMQIKTDIQEGETCRDLLNARFGQRSFP